MRARPALVCFGLAVFLGTAIGFTAPGAAQQPPHLRVDLEYRLIAPQPVETGDKIEVVDFFWYGCPYCNELYPALEAWNGRKPADVALRRIPAVLRDSWAPHARIFFALEALGEADRLHGQVYHSYHVEKLHLNQPDVAEQWAVRHGIDREKWVAAYTAAETGRKVEQAKAAARRYAVTGTPSVVVDGRFLTSSTMAETVPGVVNILEQLIIFARAERAKSAN
ncbi:MAG: thiol:disulfide interchange protein DsbA/DsbL [Betaproteobacteria bacterium]|nr:thiol:disulfide interchange protein DsbA/DsbL [Betaproteobacteria bacterium]